MKIVPGLEVPIYDSFQEAGCVVGINSTSLFEALYFEIPVFFMEDAYGTEDLMILCEEFPAFSFTCFEELSEKISKYKYTKKKGDIEKLFCKKGSINFTDNLEQILHERHT